MKPRIVIHTRHLIGSVLSKLAVEAGLDPLGFWNMSLPDFMAKLERARMN